MEKNLVDGKPESPLGTKLSGEIAGFKATLYCASSFEAIQRLEAFEKILNDMFLLMHYHRYGALYNILKKFR